MSLDIFMGALSPHVIRHLSGRLPPGFVIWCMRVEAGCRPTEPAQLVCRVRSSHSSTFYSINTDSGNACVQQSRRGDELTINVFCQFSRVLSGSQEIRLMLVAMSNS
jgi:hypothetical protein